MKKQLDMVIRILGFIVLVITGVTLTLLAMWALMYKMIEALSQVLLLLVGR